MFMINNIHTLKQQWPPVNIETLLKRHLGIIKKYFS